MPATAPGPVPPARRAFAVARAGGLFLLVSALCGVLIAAAVMPGVGAAVVGTRSAEEGLDNLPVAFATPAQSQRSVVLDANGDVLTYFYDDNRVYVGLDRIAPVMRTAIIAIEDHRFYEHGPLDLTGTARALLTNIATGANVQGGSTITQQYVKMVQIEEAKKAGDEAGVEAAQEGSYWRKIRELRYAIAVEKTLTKDQILERYLNIAYFGDGAYGVEVAAQHYFGTTAAKLTLPEAAMLAGMVQNPTALNPRADPRAALARRDIVLNRMAELGEITTANAVRAKRTTFDEDDVTSVINGCAPSAYPFLCDYVYRSLAQTPSLGATPQERIDTVRRGGLTIETAIDPKTQDTIQRRVSAVVGATDPVIGSMTMIQPGTGLIVAMAQSRPVMGSSAKKGQTYWNYSAPRSMGGAQGFQAGSTFKAITAAAALEKGIPLAKRYDARPVMDFSDSRFQTCDGSAEVGGQWSVRNSTGTNGVMDMYRAAERSVNTYFVQLELEVGMCDVVKMAEKVGIESSTPSAPISSYDDKPSFTLGTVEVDPLSVTEAYATFASGGIHCDPIVVSQITDSTGADRAAPSANCTRVISTEVAAAMNSLLSSVMTAGTGQRVATADGRPQAGKTGTIDSNAAVWFAGYTPQIAGAAMISIDNTRKPFVRSAAGYRRSNLKDYQVPSTGVSLEGSGSGDAGQEIWKPAMEAYLAGEPAESFEQPPTRLVYGDQPQWRVPGGPATGPDAGPDAGGGFWDRLLGRRGR